MGSSKNHVDMEKGGGNQMSILLHKSYLVKLSMKGEGSKNAKKTVHMVYG